MKTQPSPPFAVIIEEEPPHGDLFELAQTTVYRVVDTRTQTVVRAFTGELTASLSRETGMWEDYQFSGVRAVTLAPDGVTALVHYFDGREEAVPLEEPPMTNLKG